MTVRFKATAVALALLGPLCALTACGIRGTAVPVDAGGAPPGRPASSTRPRAPGAATA
ncbi:hypothetical protein ACFQ2B_11135 [Streptomyces stramineus]